LSLGAVQNENNALRDEVERLRAAVFPDEAEVDDDE